ncbi:MAG: hypothetical protein RL766_2255 [Bacteroidota bacterium]
MRVFKLSWFSMSAHNFLLVILLLIHHQVLAQKIDNSLRHTQKKAEWYVTSSNQQRLLFKEVLIDSGKQLNDGVPVIEIDGSKTFQSIDGFGYTLTEASAVLINRLSPQTQEKLLQELFGRANESIAISYLRIGMGATDLSTRVYSYNDLLRGETDPELKRFSLAQDTADLIPLLKRILQINPAIRIMATPWSPPGFSLSITRSMHAILWNTSAR